MNVLAAAAGGGCFFSRTNLIPSMLPSRPSAELLLRVADYKTNDDFSRSKRAIRLLSLAHTALAALAKRLSINS